MNKDAFEFEDIVSQVTAEYRKTKVKMGCRINTQPPPFNTLFTPFGMIPNQLTKELHCVPKPFLNPKNDVPYEIHDVEFYFVFLSKDQDEFEIFTAEFELYLDSGVSYHMVTHKEYTIVVLGVDYVNLKSIKVKTGTHRHNEFLQKDGSIGFFLTPTNFFKFKYKEWRDYGQTQKVNRIIHFTEDKEVACIASYNQDITIGLWLKEFYEKSIKGTPHDTEKVADHFNNNTFL